MERGHALDVLDRPALLLHDGAARSNVRLMAQYCAENGVHLAPHAKTSMSAYLVDLQDEAGAWGQTTASIVQTRQLWTMGVRKILMANVLVEPRGVAWIVDHVLANPDEEADFLCYVDSLWGIEFLERQLAQQRARRPLGVLVELGYTDGRTGARTVDDAVQLAGRVSGSRHLTLRGIAGFEGLMPRAATAPIPCGIDGYLAAMKDVVITSHADGYFERPPIVTAGGSSYFDRVVGALGPHAFDFAVSTVLRSGCYATHDHGIYQETSPFDGRATAPDGPRFTAALELVATIWSRPEPNLVIAGFGRRDVPTDDRLPVVLGAFSHDRQVVPTDAEVFAVNDHHGFLRVPATSTLGPGDVLSLGVSHPCGAFDRWRRVWVVDDHRRIVGEAVPRL